MTWNKVCLLDTCGTNCRWVEGKIEDLKVSFVEL